MLARKGSLAASLDARIDIVLHEELGTISPNIYGHFAENLGAVIYDGVWVGENSKIANVGGIRKSLVDALQKINSPVIRWPGGCFADSYDWKDGIGPAAKRPRRTNFWAGDPLVRNQGNTPQKYDPNEFGTNEFVQFCKLAGSQPYFAANVRSLPAEDFYRWVEYCNSPAGSTTLADLRAASGYKDAFNVRYWGIGNESWGCGGEMTAGNTPPNTAASPPGSRLRHRSYLHRLRTQRRRIQMDPRLFRRHVAERPERARLHLGAVAPLLFVEPKPRTHPNWNAGKGDAVNFQPVEWYELMREAAKLETLIEGHWQVMNEFDAKRRIKLVVDEWGPWYKPGSEVAPTHILGQMITQRDAVISGLTLDIFNRHPEKVTMANCAQLINCLNSLFLANGDRFLTTPVYHVFQMYAAHQGAQAIRAEFLHQRSPTIATASPPPSGA